MDVKYIVTTSTRLPELPVINGQLLYLSDKNAAYYDMGNARNLISSVRMVSELPEVADVQENVMYGVVNTTTGGVNTYIWDSSITQYRSVSGLIATTSLAGLVKPDGTTITITQDGTISSVASPTAFPASSVTYDNTSSSLAATNVQLAIDEIKAMESTAVAIAQAATSVADTASRLATTASAEASTATTIANTALNRANAATSTAATASSSAASAIDRANAATSLANTANTTANSALSLASTAINQANAATATATNAVTIANVATASASTASTIATNALNTANAATASIAALGSASAKNYTNSVSEGSADLVTSGAVKAAIDSALTATYRPAGTKTVAELTSSLLTAANVGNVYNMSNSGTTTSDFVEGAGQTISAGSNVVVIDTGGGIYKFTRMSGITDLSSYQTKVLATPLTINGSVRSTVEDALGQIRNIDTTLAVSGAAADSKATGDKIDDAVSNVVSAQSAQPYNQYNKVWFNTGSLNEITIPSYQDVNDIVLAQDTQPYNETNKVWLDTDETDEYTFVTEDDISNAIGSGLLVFGTDSGTKTCAELTSSLLTSANYKNYYTTTDSGTTTSNFINGAGKAIAAGDEVMVVRDSSSAYKFYLVSSTSSVISDEAESYSGTIAQIVDGFEEEANGINGGQFEWTLGGFIDANSSSATFGQVITDSANNYYYSSIANVVSGSKIHIITYSLGDSGIVFYSEDNKAILGIRPNGDYDADVIVPEGATTMRASMRIPFTDGKYYFITGDSIQNITNSDKNDYSQRLNKYIGFDDDVIMSDDYVDFDVERGTIGYTTGILTYASNVVRTTQFISGKGPYVIENRGGNSYKWIGIEYDSNGDYVGWTSSWNDQPKTVYNLVDGHKYKFLFIKSNTPITREEAIKYFYIYKNESTNAKIKISSQNEFLLFRSWTNYSSARAQSEIIAGDGSYIKIEYDSDISICPIVYKNGSEYIPADFTYTLPHSFSMYMEKGKSYAFFAKKNDNSSFNANIMVTKARFYRENNSTEIALVNYWVDSNLKKNDTQFNYTRLASARRIEGDSNKTLIIYNPDNQDFIIAKYDSNDNLVNTFVWGRTGVYISEDLTSGYTYEIFLRNVGNSNIDALSINFHITFNYKTNKKVNNNSNYLSIAHQGYSLTSQYYGNSRISSYYGAYYMGFDWAETDITWSSDNIPVCCHDASFVDGTSGTTIVIAEHTLAELKTYDYYGETIASFDEVLSTCKKLGLGLTIDHIAASFTDSQFITLFGIVAKYQMQKRVIWFTDNEERTIDKILTWDKCATISLLLSTELDFDDCVNLALSKATDTNHILLSANSSNFTAETLATLNVDLPPIFNMMVWTVDNLNDYAEYTPHISGIYSNKITSNMIVE